MEPILYSVYVKTSEAGYITAVNSSAFLDNTDGWVEIDSGEGDKYHHAQHHYFPESVSYSIGVWRYKLDNGEPRECTAEEIAEQEAALPEPETEESVWDELDKAYQEGVDSV